VDDRAARAKKETVARMLADLRESRRTEELENVRPGITDFQAFLQVHFEINAHSLWMLCWGVRVGILGR